MFTVCVVMALCIMMASLGLAESSETRQEKLGSFSYRIWESWTVKNPDDNTVYYYDSDPGSGRICICMSMSLGEYSWTADDEDAAEAVLNKMVEGMLNDTETSLETKMIDLGSGKAMQIQGRLAGSGAAGVLVMKEKEIFAMVLLGRDGEDLLTPLLSLAGSIQ